MVQIDARLAGICLTGSNLDQASVAGFSMDVAIVKQIQRNLIGGWISEHAECYQLNGTWSPADNMSPA